MIIKTPTTYYMTSGASEGFTVLNAFDGALMAAGIGNTNLVKMSSICPPHTREVSSITLPHGALVPVAYASITCEKPGQVIAAGVAIAFPEDEDHAGLIMEYSAQDTQDRRGGQGEKDGGGRHENARQEDPRDKERVSGTPREGMRCSLCRRGALGLIHEQ